MISYLLLFCDETLTKITRPGKTPFPPQKKEIASKQKSLESFQSNELNLL